MIWSVVATAHFCEIETKLCFDFITAHVSKLFSGCLHAATKNCNTISAVICAPSKIKIGEILGMTRLPMSLF